MTFDETPEQNVRNALTILLYSGTPTGGGVRFYDQRDVDAICARLERAIAQLATPRIGVPFSDEFGRQVTDHDGEPIA